MSDETKSYQDPLGDHMRAQAAEGERISAHYPAVASLYDGFYLPLIPAGKDGVAYLAGAEGIIGSDIRLEKTAASSGAATGVPAPDDLPRVTLALQTIDGATITQLDAESSQRINAFLVAGWQVRCVLSLVTFNADSRGFAGEFACLCYNLAAEPAHAEALKTFIANIVERITVGDHPGLHLTQQQLIHVLESNGAWYLTKAVPLPERSRGWAIYKRKKSPTEYLVAAALRRNKGCLIGSWVGLFVLIVLVGWLVWYLVQNFW
jgi:hypothetical protein